MLADGRELFYFDEAATDADRAEVVDRRALPQAHTSSTMRLDRILDEWVTIAGHRQDRTYLPPDNECPLCPSRPGHQSEIPATDYDVVVFENRFPSFALTSIGDEGAGDGVFTTAPGAGRCEVVCFTSEHDAAFSSLTPSRVRTVIDAWVDRTVELSRIPQVEQVFCFENRGEEIGVTLSHPHGQIYGYPFVPPRFYRTAEAFERHREKTGECLQCMLLAAEVADGSRVVIESDHWVAYVPFAARWPYEVRVVPRRHVPDLPALEGPERKDLAGVYVGVLRAFDSLFDTPTPYIANWQQAPVRQSREVWHLAAELFTIRRAEGRLKYLAGSESGAAVWINDIAPEVAAEELRERVT
jgi:UDPglucose--hexose-1-phosphate uridylyltransferase